MNTEQTWQLLREVADTLEFDEEPDVDVPASAEGLDELLARLSVIGAAVGWLRNHTKSRMADHLGAKGFARFGPRVYRVGLKRTVKARREVEGELWEFIGPHARRLFNPNYPRWGELKKMAEDFVDRETGEVGYAAFETRFYDVEEGETEVKEMPWDRAPKFIQDSEGVTKRD